MPTKLYLRRNGSFGASCDGVEDTGHHITEDSGRFTVYSLNDPDVTLCENVYRSAAEAAIEREWRAS